MNTLSEVIKNVIVICCIQILHFIIQILYYLLIANEEPLFAFFNFAAFGLFYMLPFIFGTLISIVILPKITQVVISQVLFIIIAYIFSILIEIKDIDIGQWFCIAGLGSILIVLFVKFGYEACIWYIYQLQQKK